MTVEEASAWVCCDSCGENIEVGLIEMADGSWMVDEGSFYGTSWTIAGECHYCSEKCAPHG